MKFLYDQNLSYRLVADLQDLYPDSLHVRDIGMKEYAAILRFEQSETASFFALG